MRGPVASSLHAAKTPDIRFFCSDVITSHTRCPQEMKKNLLDMIGDDVDGTKANSLGAMGGGANAGTACNKAVGDAGPLHLQQRDHIVGRGASVGLGAVGNMSQMGGIGSGHIATNSHSNASNAAIGFGLVTSASAGSSVSSFSPSMSSLHPQNLAQVIRAHTARHGTRSDCCFACMPTRVHVMLACLGADVAQRFGCFLICVCGLFREYWRRYWGRRPGRGDGTCHGNARRLRSVVPIQ